MESRAILDKIYNMIETVNYKLFHIWITQIIFSWRWWLAVTLSILPWIVWLKIRDKRDTVRLLFVGLVVMLVTNIMDNIGLSYNLWHYDSIVTPLPNLGLPWDYSLFPVGIMIIIQFCPKINAYIKSAGFAFVTAFIYEPFFVWIAMYHQTNWKYWYSFVIYIPLYLFFNYIYESKLFRASYFN